MKEKKNTTMLIIITIAVFLVAVIGATFAYFATERNVGSAINVNVGTAASIYSFSATSPDKIEMNIAFNEMSQASVSNTVLKNATANIEVSLSSPTDDTLTTCTYDIVWVWDGNENNRYTTADVTSLPYIHDEQVIREFGSKESYEEELEYYKDEAGNVDWDSFIYDWELQEYVYNYEFSTKVDGANEKDLSNIEEDGKTVKLQEGLSISSDSTTATTKTHEIQANIYNLPVNQTKLFGKNFKAYVTIDNLNCSMKEIDMTPLQTTADERTLAYYINSVYNSEVNRKNITRRAAGLYYHNEALANGANDKTLRYAGADADVNNYVCFEGDDCVNNLYRIISVDSETNQTKVIKATKLASNMSWNDSGENTWVGGSLETYLNGTYLNELKSKTNKIVKTIWHVGGFPDSQMRSSTPKQIYDTEKADTITYEKEIGLMYISEYGFAALPEYWTHVLGYNSTNGYNLNKGKDWMLTNDNPWTISRYFDVPTHAFRAGFAVGAVGGSFVNAVIGVRPSFVLSADVKITNAGAEGVGSKDKPMIIV